MSERSKDGSAFARLRGLRDARGPQGHLKGKLLQKDKPSLSPRFLRENEGKSEGLRDIFAKLIRTDRLCKILAFGDIKTAQGAVLNLVKAATVKKSNLVSCQRADQGAAYTSQSVGRLRAWRTLTFWPSKLTREFGGTDSVTKVLPAITEPSPTTVSPPRTLALE